MPLLSVDEIRRQFLQRGNALGADVPPSWMMLDNGSPLWLPRSEWPEDLKVLPMPGDELKLSLRMLTDMFAAADEPQLAERARKLTELGGRTADATVVAVHGRLGVLADNTVLLVGAHTEKLSVICRKVTGDTPLRLAAHKCGRTPAVPGPLQRLSVSAWRQQPPGRRPSEPEEP